MNTVDLHTHSTYSDGTYTPEELVRYGKEKGLSAIALTDHDTLDGISEALDCGRRYGIEVIPGIEISAEYDNSELHIAGLFVDNENKEFISALENLRRSRESRNIEMVEKLNQIGVNIDYKKVLSRGRGSVITRAHIAREVVDNGYALSNNEVFERYIGKGKPAYVKRQLMSWQETLRLIKESGGLPVLAHPLLYKMSGRRLEAVVADLAAGGLAAIEAYYSTHSQADVKYVKTLAEKNNLKLSGGSDFHGTNKPKLDLGRGYGDLKVPYEVLLELKKELNRQRGV